jgi:hypothetical protein
LREEERFASEREKKQFADSPWAKRILNYVESRQNEDGGYTFCQGTESNAQDTYYGLAILNLLETPFPNPERTLSWLRNFVPDSHYSHYNVAKALQLCNEKPHGSLRDFLLSLRFVRGELEADNVYIEVASEFELAFMITELLSMVTVEVDRQKTTSWLLKYKNEDGGFGIRGLSNLNATYHAVASLFNLGYPVKNLHDTIGYVRSCEKPYGGFTVIPRSFNPYMEHVYYGASTLELLSENVRYPASTVAFVLECQNLNGGFARSDLGISTFEYTFFAVSVLKMITGNGRR